ncbi:MAG: hypothetical protein U0T57_02645 [Buchnera aphidicola (Kaburagia rhusicola rhusicola)]
MPKYSEFIKIDEMVCYLSLSRHSVSVCLKHNSKLILYCYKYSNQDEKQSRINIIFGFDLNKITF